ncbi:MAG TPA: FKBP-type peptidyl-prolyl cis-trans isomerase [Thermoplasmata archaeon]|nr:FKBP-type peptidyl-prolyl cis-trans isomerase [Thermoplasmata archaeon]
MASDETVQKGDIVWLEYDAWTVNPNGTQTLFDTTHEEVAKKENKFDEKKVYVEQPVIVGKDRLFKGLEEAIVGAKIGETKDVTIPPEKGAGARDARLVELKTEREFLRQEINPEVGLDVAIGGRRGIITNVAAGRVRVDFNNPLAGKTLKYVVKPTKKAATPEERIRAVLDMDYGLAEQFKIQLTGDVAEIQLPDVCKTDEKWFVSKFRVVADLREVSDAKLTRFIEEYEKKEPKKEEEKPAEAKAEEPKKASPAPKAGGRKARQPKPKPVPAPEAPVEEELPKEEKAPEEL